MSDAHEVRTGRPPRLSAAGVRDARSHVDPAFLDTPQFVSESLSLAVGARVLCKVECVNPIRSFKGRGAHTYVSRLVAAGERPTRLVCASAGNFGQGLAHAARAHGLPVTVFHAVGANPLKVEAMRRLGADLRAHGRDLDDAKDAARRWSAGEGVPFVEDGREPAISEGAGTIAVELTAGRDPFDVALVPLGNGALLAGVGTWLRAERPGVRIVAVCAAGAPAMARSLAAGTPISTARVETIADGIAVRVPIPEALADLDGLVDDVLLVEDALVVDAMRLLHDALGLVVEPAGAVGIAALLADRGAYRDATVAVPLCGGNVTAEQRRRWL